MARRRIPIITWAKSVLPAFIGGSGHAEARSIAERPFGVQIDTTHKSSETRMNARSPAIDHHFNRTVVERCIKN
jgi:hypothetical protein